MPSIINSDNGVVSGTSGLKTTGGNDGLLSIQTNGSTAMSINASQQVTFNNGVTMPNTFGFENRVINGAMAISQRNGTSSVNVSGVSYVYQMDRFYCGGLNGVATPFTLQQVTDAPTGFTNSVRITVANADALGNAATEYGFQQTIEANNTSDFSLGTANAVAVTLSFWVKSSLTGTFGVGIRNAPTFNRTYVGTYTINSANTWEFKSISLTMDTTGTWNQNGPLASINLSWSLGVGTNLRGTAGVWQAGGAVQTSGSVNLVSTAGATWQITGVQFERGSAATSFDFRSIGTELALCQRYYEKSYNQDTVPGTSATSGYSLNLFNTNSVTTYYVFAVDKFAVVKRAAATMRFWDIAGNLNRVSNYSLGGLVRTDNNNSVFSYTGFQQNAVMINTQGVATGSGYQWDASAEL